MVRRLLASGLVICMVWLMAGCAGGLMGWDRGAGAGPRVYVSKNASELERFAAREVQRYLYLRSGVWSELRAVERLPPRPGAAIIIAGARDPLARDAAAGAGAGELAGLEPQQTLLRTVHRGGAAQVLIAGGDDAGTLYGAYRLAEHLGVRFYLHGDVVPDEPLPAGAPLPELNELRRPLFALRGIQPFHDFPEGPDWWNLDDYRAIISQLPKLGMNFFGLHTYPEAAPHAEPTVWIGPAEDVNPDGTVRRAYLSTYANTVRERVVPGNWGYEAKAIDDFAYGADQLFERDPYSAEVMAGHCPAPQGEQAEIEVFNRTGAMLGSAFAHARRLGVRTCIGTEAPLTVPSAVAARLRADGRATTDSATLASLYTGIFTRLARLGAPDFYWLWTPEGWTWSGTTDEAVQRTMADMQVAYQTLKAMGLPMQLATCGWVLGPPSDSALFDRTLPRDVSISCINRLVGNEPVERGFARITGRPTWAIPWLEDDPGLSAPQLWAARMRRDAFDARRYGCSGLMGIHWRTRVLAPNIAALARAGWEPVEWPASARQAGAIGGAFAAFTEPVEGTDEDALYQTVRYQMRGYALDVPNGSYRVTLKFIEPFYREAGKRIFGVDLQGRRVIERLDLLERVGFNHALDFTFEDVQVSDGWLAIDFEKIVELPAIAAIAVEGPVTRRINCGGPAWGDYAADWPAEVSAESMPPIDDFYADWARAEFGPEVGAEAAAILARIDGKLPRPADWINGPGGMAPDPKPWSEVAVRYGYVDELVALRPRVRGAGNLERFDYWLNQFRMMRAMGRLRCDWTRFNQAMAQVKAAETTDTRRRLAREVALPVRRELITGVAEAYGALLAFVGNPGELGTVCNWEEHIVPSLLTRPGQELQAALGEGTASSLPVDAEPSHAYGGPPRVFVPTLRTSAAAGEPFAIKATVLSAGPVESVTLRHRAMGARRFAEVAMRHVARGVYEAELPAGTIGERGLEYYVEARVGGAAVRFPATAPGLNQTVVLQ